MSDKELIEKIEDAYCRVRKIGPDAIYETELREVLRAAADALEAATSELTEAIRLTVEYVGNDMLPAIEGWDWYDALVKYAPEVAQAFVDKPIHFPKSAERDAALAAIERVRAEANAYAKQPDVMEPCGAVAQSILLALDGAPERLSNHCQKCGALGSVETHLRGCSLDGAPEPAWEYGVQYIPPSVIAGEPVKCGSERAARLAVRGSSEPVRLLRRRPKVVHPAGPWLPVEGEKP